MPSPDWRSGRGYEDVAAGGRRGLAWEFLRRNPDYIADVGDGSDGGSSEKDERVEPWGLRFRGRPFARLAICQCLLAAGGRSRCGVVRFVARELQRRADSR